MRKLIILFYLLSLTLSIKAQKHKLYKEWDLLTGLFSSDQDIYDRGADEFRLPFAFSLRGLAGYRVHPKLSIATGLGFHYYATLQDFAWSLPALVDVKYNPFNIEELTINAVFGYNLLNSIFKENGKYIYELSIGVKEEQEWACWAMLSVGYSFFDIMKERENGSCFSRGAIFVKLAIMY